MPERRLLGPIGARLTLAIVAVALAGIASLSLLTLAAAREDVRALGHQQQQRAVESVAAVAGDAFRSSGSWATADLRLAVALAASNSSSLTVLDATGQSVSVPTVAGSDQPAKLEGPVLSAPITVDANRVGTAVVHHYRDDLPVADVQLRDALARSVAIGAAVAALLALIVAIGLSRWIVRPVSALTAAVRSLESGDRRVRVGSPRGPSELAELGAAFDRMADTVAREDELRRAVVADVAHELRTPLAILQAGSESLADGVVEPDERNLSSLHDEVLRLGRIIEDLDTLASAEAATLRLRRHPIDLADVTAHTVDALRPFFERAEVGLVVRTSRSEAFADAHRVDQILTNLLSNALKFTPPGGTVGVTVTPEKEAVVVQVHDTGVGILPDELPHVFERFWRGRESGRVAGSGIGLAVVRALVDAHGGDVAAESAPSRGTCFTVRLPRRAPDRS